MNKKKVVLLGDSIRLLGYGTKIEEELGKEYQVLQFEDNGRFVSYTLRMLFDYYDQIKDADIIHWNNGLWDICELFDDGPFTRKEDYIYTTLRIAKILKNITPNVIFATTTPVRKANPYNRNSVIEEYNDAIVPLLKDMKVEINDLYKTLSKDVDKYIREDDNLHLTESGIEVCVKQVADCIKKIKQ